MIRRDLRLPDGAPGWLLISQVEHARISAQLAGHLTTPLPAAGAAAPRPVRSEVLAAVLHHDDGWADWERAPRLDERLGRPVGFLELRPAEALAIWTRSIHAAADEGPLAAWIVAGHFLRLLSFSDSARGDAAASAWQREFAGRRDAWLAEWQARDERGHTREAAEAGLQWLWTFDRASLWLCCDAPAPGGERHGESDFNPAGGGTPLEMHFSAPESLPPPGGDERVAVAADPWRFDVEAINVDAEGMLVPAGPYTSPARLLAAGRPHTLRWRLAAADAEGRRVGAS
jgi:hypothetical protein